MGAISGSDMKQLNTVWLYRLGKHLHYLRAVLGYAALQGQGQPILLKGNAQLISELVWARAELLRFSKSHDINLRRCHDLARKLIQFVDRFVPSLPEDPIDGQQVTITLPEYMDSTDATLFSEDIQNFEAVLMAELADANIFLLEEKGVYSSRALIEDAERAFPDVIRKRMPGIAIYDVQQGGRCLACDCPTASGFHMLRAVESIMKEYIEKAGGNVLADRNWFDYITSIAKQGGSQKVTDQLKAIKNNFRNPLMHPEDVLEPDQALGLFGVCVAVITVLIEELTTRGM